MGSLKLWQKLALGLGTLVLVVVIFAPRQEPAAGTDEQVCNEYRGIALGAFGESMSESEVIAGVHEVERLALGALIPSIRDNARTMAVNPQEAAAILIEGRPNAAQDDLAESCNQEFPI